jgi:hypothetical protein
MAQARTNVELAPHSLLTRFGMAGPGALPLTDTDLLLFGGRSTDACTLLANGMLLNPAGDLIPFSFALAVAADRSYSYTTFTPGAGLLLSLSLVAVDATTVRGQTYVQAVLYRGAADVSTLWATLISGYVTGDMSLWWPGGINEHEVSGQGAMRSLAGTNPAAGAELSITVPDSTRWRILAMRASLVTSGVAATRQVHLQITDGTTVVMDLPAVTTQIASLTRVYNAVASGFGQALADTQIYLPLPMNLYVAAGWTIVTLTTLLDVGDDWGAPQLYVEEWLED